MTRFRYMAIFLTPIILVLVAVVWIWNSVGPLEYPRVLLDRQPSPDGSWVASVNEDHTSLGFGGDSIDAGVSLAPSRHPDQALDLLGVDTGGHDEDRPRIEWSGSNTLKVTVSTLIYLNVLTLHAQGVEVDLHLDPDDPPAVTAWLREKGLLSEATGDATTR